MTKQKFKVSYYSSDFNTLIFRERVLDHHLKIRMKKLIIQNQLFFVKPKSVRQLLISIYTPIEIGVWINFLQSEPKRMEQGTVYIETMKYISYIMRLE